MTKKLTFEDITKAAQFLNVEPCAVQAVVAVESAGAGFLADGRVKILFEGHVFYKELQKRGVDPAPLAAKYPNIVYPKWDKTQYKGGAAEHSRLTAAMLLNEEAALCSASYGLFQIMGFNHKLCGFDTVQAFVDAQGTGEAAQLDAFCAFIQADNLASHLRRKAWAAFAKQYNGPAYAKNQYDIKLEQAYTRCRAVRG